MVMGESDENGSGPRRSGRTPIPTVFLNENKGKFPTEEQAKSDREQEAYTQKMSDVNRAIAQARLDVMRQGCIGRTYVDKSKYVTGQNGLFASKDLHIGTEIAILGDAVPVIEADKQAAHEYTQLSRHKIRGMTAYQEFTRRASLDKKTSKTMYDNGWAANDGERSPTDMAAKPEAENACNATIVEAKSFDNRVVTFLMALKKIPRGREILVSYGNAFWSNREGSSGEHAGKRTQPASEKTVQQVDLTQRGKDDDAQTPGGAGGVGSVSFLWDCIEEWRDECNTPQKLQSTWDEIDASESWNGMNDTNFIYDGLCKQEFATLKPGEFIGDAVIDCWCDYSEKKAWTSSSPIKHMIVKAIHWQNIRNGVHSWDALDTEINQRLGIVGVSTIFDLDRIIIPVHVNNNHWYVANVIITTNSNNSYNVVIEFYDSLPSPSEEGHTYKESNTKIVNWLTHMHGQNTLVHYDEYKRVDCPVQTRSDCAIFTGVNAVLLSVGLPLTHFNQESASKFRTWFTCLIWESFKKNGRPKIPPITEKDKMHRKRRREQQKTSDSKEQAVDLTGDASDLSEKAPYLLDLSHTYAMPDQMVTYRIPHQLHRSMYLLKL